MAVTVEVDRNSGFCAGVIRAIKMAEDFLDRAGGKKLYSLGSIVHNESELDRLSKRGVVTIDRDDLGEMVRAKEVLPVDSEVSANGLDREVVGERDSKGRMPSVEGETLVIRAHGEPPQTYQLASAAGFALIDCTCPVVLKLQKDIKEAYERRRTDPRGGMIVIFGKVGHAEVLGLLGQVDGDALVIENRRMLEQVVAEGKIDLRSPVEIFSQTTKSPAEYAVICSRLEEMMATANEFPIAQFKGRQMLIIHNTICSQVATRFERLSRFALDHDIIVFVSGKSSSNGKILCDLCKSLNIRTYHITSPEDIRREWFAKDDSVGICGATSTPKWLLEETAEVVRRLCKS